MKILFECSPVEGVVLRVVRGDLTAEEVDAIVNAANEHLAHGGGVAGAIVRQGGSIIQQESSAWVNEHGPVPTGSAAITSAGSLPARHVIHAVGPVWGTGNEDAKLAGAIRASLDLAREHGLNSISFPAISSGIFGFPKERCACVFYDTITDWLSENDGASLREIRLCNIDDETSSIFEAEAARRHGR